MDNKTFNDQELKRILAAARHPDLPKGFAERLQQKLEAEAPSNVVPFPQKQKTVAPRSRMWLSAIPLAASLAAGIYIGAMGSLPESLSGLDSLFASSLADNALNLGIEDTESFLNGELS